MNTRSDNNRTYDSYDPRYDSRFDYVRDPYNDYYDYRAYPNERKSSGGLGKAFATGVFGALVAMAVVSGVTVFVGASHAAAQRHATPVTQAADSVTSGNDLLEEMEELKARVREEADRGVLTVAAATQEGVWAVQNAADVTVQRDPQDIFYEAMQSKSYDMDYTYVDVISVDGDAYTFIGESEGVQYRIDVDLSSGSAQVVGVSEM